MRVWSVFAFLTVVCAGCTHCQLGRSALLQAGSVTDLHYKQVLSNLASFHSNPDVLPHFAVVGTGGTSVNDQASLSAELEWSFLFRQMYVPGATRAVEEQWTLAPVVNPDKLRAIRCLYQLVAFGRATDREADKLLTAFLGEGYMEWVDRGWYGVGRSKDVPRNACHVAHCGPKYVWVTPEGLEGLSRLTLVVLNVATLDPTPPSEQPTKTVQKYTYKDGKLDAIETYTRPDPDAPKGSSTPSRKDFYNPLQSQIQMRGR
jgi:hypothetical protein